MVSARALPHLSWLLCSIAAPQVTNFDSLSTLICILESSVADIQFSMWKTKAGGCHRRICFHLPPTPLPARTQLH